MTYDIEQFFDDLKSFLQSNINTKIAEINTEKADDVSMGTIATDAYVFQSMDSEVANYNPYIFYGLSETSTNAIRGASAVQYTASVVVVLTQTIDDDNDRKRLLRYSRVLKELFESNWSKIGTGITLEVDSLEPIAFQLVNASHPFRAVGVDLRFTLA